MSALKTVKRLFAFSSSGMASRRFSACAADRAYRSPLRVVMLGSARLSTWASKLLQDHPEPVARSRVGAGRGVRGCAVSVFLSPGMLENNNAYDKLFIASRASVFACDKTHGGDQYFSG